MSTESQSATQKKDDEISFKELILIIQDWWKFLLSKWLIIILIGLLGGAVGYFYSTLKNPVYSASTTFVLEDSNDENVLGNLGGIASMVGVNPGMGSGLFQGDNIFELYKSRSMVEKTLLTKVDKGNKLLIDYYIEANKLRETWKDTPELQGIDFHSKLSSPKQNRLRDSIIGTIVKNINGSYLKVSKLDEKLSIYNAVVESEDEFFAKNFNEQIVKNVNDFYVQTKTKKSLKNVQILERKVDSVRSEINGTVYTAAAVDDATPNLNPTRRTNKTVSMQLSQISTETNSAILNELVKNLELTKMNLLKEAPLIQIVDEPILPLEKKQLSPIKAIVVGGFLFGFLIVLFFSIRWQYLNVMKEND